MNVARLLARLILGKRLPRTEGVLSVPGLQQAVTVRRDDWGIPHIAAQHERDAWFALGFCHGQDRAFQLETLLRVVRGTLAQLVGGEGLAVDRLSRRIGFYHSACAQWNVLDDEVQLILESYAGGINEGATRGLSQRPHELVLLRRAPTPWTARDILGMVKLQSFLLASNWDVELARLQILSLDGPEALTALDPRFPEWLPATTPNGVRAGMPALERLAAEVTAFQKKVPLGGGSNNWAMRSSRTRTGRPLLACDPHLSANLPSHWYLAHLHTPEWSVAGASFVGVPAFAVGHNGQAAWGLTAGLVDNTDLFREEIGPEGRSVRQGSDFISCPVRTETIAIKGQPAVTENVLQTPRGPIVSPVLEGAHEALSLRATWLDPQPIRGLFVLHRVRSFAEFRTALSCWPAGSLNMVYADVSDTVGWQLAGTAPRRKHGWGLLPQPGWLVDSGWEQEPVPFADMPYCACPPGSATDFVATANSSPLPEGQGPYLGADWIDGYRQAALVEQIQQRTDWDIPATQRLQTSVLARPWQEIKPLVLALPADDPDVKRALDLLRTWDGALTVDSAAGSVYELFLMEMAQRVARARAPQSFRAALGQGYTPLTPLNFFCFRRTGHLVRLLRAQPSGWFSRSWAEEMGEALRQVMRHLLARSQGADIPGWGRLRQVTMHHPLGARKPLAPLFNLGPVPCPGDTDTIAQGSVLPLDPLADCDNLASLRAIFDVGRWDESRVVLPGGQSGNPFSPHHGDQFPLWQRGETIRLVWSEGEVAKHTRATLELHPQAVEKR